VRLRDDKSNNKKDKVMKSLEELKNSIYEKINEIRNFSNDDSKLFNEEGGYNYEELNAFLERNKKKNYMKAACMRMIKNYLDRLYDGWKFYEKDYLVYVNDFKKFG
jgi:gas vesicle protein